MILRQCCFFSRDWLGNNFHIYRLNRDLVKSNLVSDVSNEKRAPGCLRSIGDQKLPSYTGIIMKHYKDPY